MNPRLTIMKPAVDVAVVADLRLLFHPSHLAIIYVQFPESAGRYHARDGDELAVLHVVGLERREVHIADTVAVGQHEIIAGDVPRDPTHPPDGHCRLAGLGQRDRPVLGVAVAVNLNAWLRSE